MMGWERGSASENGVRARVEAWRDRDMAGLAARWRVEGGNQSGAYKQIQRTHYTPTAAKKRKKTQKLQPFAAFAPLCGNDTQRKV
jgi:hypothetical protein